MNVTYEFFGYASFRDGLHHLTGERVSAPSIFFSSQSLRGNTNIIVKLSDEQMRGLYCKMKEYYTFAVHDGHRTDWDSRIHCHARTLRGIRCMNPKKDGKLTCKRHKKKKVSK